MTTTPLSGPISTPSTMPEIEATFGDGDPSEVQSLSAPSMTAEWRQFGAFLKRPSLDVGASGTGAWTVIARIYALDMLAMFALLGLASVLISLDVYIPETALSGMEITWGIVALVVIGAPVMEEVAFRSWLSGRPGHWLGLALLGVAAVGFGLVHSGQATDNVALSISGIALGFVAPILAIIAFVRGTRKPPIGWFTKGFPVFFWLSTVAFALVHLANFEDGSLTMLLPLVLPQFILGTMLGYLRVRLGLWSAIVLHAAHNGTAISIAALAGALG